MGASEHKLGLLLAAVGAVGALAVIPEVRAAACSMACSSYAEAEAKVLREVPLGRLDLARLDRAELQRLRNAVYAHHGYPFETPQLRTYFSGKPWYQLRHDYSESMLTVVDFENVQRIKAAEQRSAR